MENTERSVQHAQMYHHLTGYLLHLMRPHLISSARWRLWVLFGVCIWLLMEEVDTQRRSKSLTRIIDGYIGMDDYDKPVD